MRLNPCCCGRWSQRVIKTAIDIMDTVLILVVVEDGLRDAESDFYGISQIMS